MAAPVFTPARMATPGGSGIFPARWYETASNATFLKGAPVVATTGLIDECGTNPALILGVANENALSGPGFLAANSPTVITNRQNRTSITVAGPSVVFSGRLVNNSDTTIAPVVADREADYGITKQTSGWAVDKNKTAANARVHIVAIDTDNNIVYFKFLTANCQEP